jgi:hypothetical protein
LLGLVVVLLVLFSLHLEHFSLMSGSTLLFINVSSHACS